MPTTPIQHGSLRIRDRARGEPVWQFRYRATGQNSRRVQKSEIVGTLAAYPTEEAMRAKLRGFLFTVNTNAPEVHPPFDTVIDRFIAEEQLEEIKAGRANSGTVHYSTANAYLLLLKRHLRPLWGSVPVNALRPIQIQQWLNSLPLAPKTRANIKGLFHRLFEKAMLWEYLERGRNPMELVEVKGQSRRRRLPTVLTAEQFQAILRRLQEPTRTMVLVAQCTGLRISEILGLQWRDFDFENLTVRVTRGVVNGRVGDVKTEYSEDLLPLQPDLASALLEWRKQAPPSAEGWLFANPVTQKPYHARSMARHHFDRIRTDLGIRFSWHSFRHTYRSWLDATGAPIGVQQKLMRHAQVSTTMNTYGNALMQSKRDANAKVTRLAIPPETGPASGERQNL
jgi:integrase